MDLKESVLSARLDDDDSVIVNLDLPFHVPAMLALL